MFPILSRLRFCFLCKQNRRGFTLLEVLIAFTVLTLGATVMLQQLYTIMKYSERSLAKQALVAQSLNEANMLSAIKWKEVSARLTEKELLVSRTDEEGKEKKIKVNNYKYEDVDVPMTVAFSPFQVFDFGGDGDFAVRLLQPGLLPNPDSPVAVKGRTN
ncbi:MAG: prepilin-type N-terminal cleavage/methylation domain-containing protein [Alphaproteobacteria bacterium]|nr:MAG: prepilin-type N-terminal cleavage/methylation domain-containing protein [Alphaproteobacteria bacterium]